MPRFNHPQRQAMNVVETLARENRTRKAKGLPPLQPLDTAAIRKAQRELDDLTPPRYLPRPTPPGSKTP